MFLYLPRIQHLLVISMAIVFTNAVAFSHRLTAQEDPSIQRPGSEFCHLVEQAPVAINKLGDNHYLVDFGKVAFGNLQVTSKNSSVETVTFHFGEKLSKGVVDRKPPGTVRYAVTKFSFPNNTPAVIAPPADARNTEQGTEKHPPAVLTPQEWGVVVPFRWVEVVGWNGELQTDQIIRRAAFLKSWDENAADFSCSDDTLNGIWDLCKYSIKATTFAGVYVDGDRERIPYEADAYLNQLSHYYTDTDIHMARRSFDWLMANGTWPTEWAPHMVFMAYADFEHTADLAWLAPRFESLKTKTLMDRAGEDGLIRSNQENQTKTDIVDWPKKERDNYVFTEVNTVVNAFHLAALKRMQKMAAALGQDDDADYFQQRYTSTLAVFNKTLFNEKRGLYVDGIGTDHSSQHANFFPLAFGLVPPENQTSVVNWLKGTGMNCSPYAAQYLMEALFEHNAAQKALDLITADTDRSWKHMLNSGTTISWEAWDLKYKSNQDWNHAWGAAPANLLPRYVLGVQPEVPGWKSVLISPCVGELKQAQGKIPTPQGPVIIHWKNDKHFQLHLELPGEIPATVRLPATPGSQKVLVNGVAVDAKFQDGHWQLDQQLQGKSDITVE